MTRPRILTAIGAACLAAGAAGAAPTGVAVSPDGARVFVATGEPPAVAVVDRAAGTVTASWPLDAPPTGLAVSADGSRLVVTAGLAPGRLVLLDAAGGGKLGEVAAGHSPCAPVAEPAGARVFTCNRFEDRVDVFDVANPAAGRLATGFPVVREPGAAVLRPDGRLLFVANRLPAGRADTGDIAAVVSVIDTATGTGSTVRLPTGSTGVHGLAASPDGRFVYAVHTLSRFGLPTTQLDRGWMNTSALSILDAANPALVATVLVDEVDRGAANPAGVACLPDGRFLAIAHTGTHEVSVIDRAALHERVDRALRGEAVTEVSRSAADLPNDLSLLHGIRRRIALTGRGPGALVAFAGGFATACQFSGTLHLLDVAADGAVSVRDVQAAPPPADDAARRGERLFWDATTCFQHWQSCATCHPDGRADALNWDLLNDGIGNPKQSKSLLFSLQTPPAMITGIRPTGEYAVRSGMRYIQFAVRPEEEALAIDAYLRGMQPVPSPALVDGKLSPAAERGRAVYEKAGCASCHPGEFFTDCKAYDVGTGLDRDAGRAWDTPTLREAWRTAPYLHDGRAATLEEVVGPLNAGDRHGTTSTLSEAERRELVEYLRSL